MHVPSPFLHTSSQTAWPATAALLPLQQSRQAFNAKGLDVWKRKEDTKEGPPLETKKRAGKQKKKENPSTEKRGRLRKREAEILVWKKGPVADPCTSHLGGPNTKGSEMNKKREDDKRETKRRNEKGYKEDSLRKTTTRAPSSRKAEIGGERRRKEENQREKEGVSFPFKGRNSLYTRQAIESSWSSCKWKLISWHLMTAKLLPST